MKYLGIVICLGIIIGAVSNVGIHFFNDILSAVFVTGGALGYALLKNGEDSMANSFGQGAVYFGWLGLLIGLIAIASNAVGVLGSVEKMGPTLAMSMLPLLYGYVIRLVCMAATSTERTE